MRWKMPLLAIVVVGAAAFVALNPNAKSYARSLWDRLNADQESTALAESAPRPPSKSFDGVLELTPANIAAVGIDFVKVMPQTEPLRLRISGRTDYDPNTQNKIRPKFKSKIDKVYVEYGETVKQGDPLVDLFSADLAMAKGDYETKLAQWEYDRGESVRVAKLKLSGAASDKEIKTAENAEKKSSTDYKIAKDKLMVFGLSEAEVDLVPKEEGVQKAKMTLRAPTAGVVIARNVVNDNVYDDNDTLLTIAPLDHFWVYGYVYPSDAGRVTLGQTWVVEYPNSGPTPPCKVESITSEIDKDTRTLVIRTHINNKGNKIKADMMVSGYLEIPPPKDQPRTVIPRLSMVSGDGGDFVFVLKPPDGSAGAETDKGTQRYERRRIRIIQEGAKSVIVAAGDPPKEGLAVGEQIASRGALILMQMYEDAATVDSGAPR